MDLPLFDFGAAADRRGLAVHARRLKQMDLASLQDEPDRVKRWVLSPKGLGWRFDFTKQCLDREAWNALLGLAQDAQWKSAIESQFRGAPINATEGRAVLHMALRASEHDSFEVDGQSVVPEVLKTREAFLTFADAVRSGEIAAADGGCFTDVINIGIGGSDLGPVMVHEALAPVRRRENQPVRVHFVSNVDPFHLDQVLDRVDAKRTLLVIVSKTFTTQETMANARRALSWLHESLGSSATAHLAAVSSNVKGAGEMGISADRVFGFDNWVGGRFSGWGPVGLSIALGSGSAAFRALLEGARGMDVHFRSADAEENVPLHLALLEIWNVNFMGAMSRAVLPYAQAMHRLPAYLQQAEMESNGKSIGRDGLRVSWSTHPVVWGEPGTNGQHAFHQLLHQGTSVHPVDFIAIKEPMGDDADMHGLLLTNAMAQAEAFCTGRTLSAVREEMERNNVPGDTIDRVAPHRTFEGGRPSTFMLGDRLDAHGLGALLSAFEHKIFLEGVFWGIYSFDQWGVELGKVLANELSNGNTEASWTPGTKALKQAVHKRH